MLNFYTTIVVEVVFLMMFLAAMARTNDLLSKHKQKQLLLLFVSVVVGILAEWSSSLAALSGGEHREVIVWTKMVELSVTPFVPFLCAEVLRRTTAESQKDKWFYGILIIPVFHVGLELISAFNGFIYYVDADGVFRHGSFYWIYLVAYLGGALYVLLIGYRVCRQYQSKNRIMLVFMLAFLLFGIVVNQLDTSVKSAWLTVAIVVTLLYIFYNDMLQRVDERTMLLNRSSYRNLMLDQRRPVMIQLFDIDSFKMVNDEHGSAYGNQCLQRIGRIIRKVYGRYGKCCRIDDDGFCVILDSDKVSMSELNDRFLASLRDRHKTDPRFPYVSFGYVRYDPARESVKDAEQAVSSILHRNKERNKIKYGPALRSAERERSSFPAQMAEGRKLASEPRGASGSVVDESETCGPVGVETTTTGLDISGLSDRAFTAFSATTARNYLYLCNMATGVSRWSSAAVEYFGLPGEYMFDAGKIWESCIHPQDRQMYHDDIDAVFSGRKRVHELEYRVKNRLGEYIVCTCRGVVLKGDGADPDLFAGTIVNHGIVDAVDPVTSLHTSTDFAKSLHRLIEERTPVCVVKLGIEHLYHVNAMYGQEGGNRVLRLFGIELQDLVAGRGRAFRLDGAKFAFYLYGAGQEETQELFQQLREVAENDIQIDNLRIPLRIYGGAMQLDHQQRYNEYIVHSNLIYAMEQSLENYRNELVFSENLRRMANVENIQIHAEIHRSAMEGCRNFFLCYQPIVSFETGKVIGAEALLRWKQEPYEIVPPDSFIPWLENDPAFIPVGNWIVRQAILETAPLRQADPDFVLNVNIADTQLKYSNFREDVLNILADTGCPPESLCLELTERCRRMNPDFLADELRFFRSRGITIALDDFGTGMSSMALLIQLPIDELKVDRVFLLNALVSERNLALMKNIIRTSRELGLHTCVEGIETKEQRDLVSSLGGDYYQGYYATKPLPIEEFLEFCRERREA